LSATPTDINNEWRVHYHVPINTVQLHTQGLMTTRDAIIATLDFLQCNENIQPQLEVETYTWKVLPNELRPSNDEELITGLCEELNWLQAGLAEQQLLNT